MDGEHTKNLVVKYRKLLNETEAREGSRAKHRSIAVGLLEKSGQKPVPVVYVSSRMPKSTEANLKRMKYRAANAPKNIDEYKFSPKVTGIVTLSQKRLYIKTVKNLGLGKNQVAFLSRKYFKALGGEPPFSSVYFQNATPDDFINYMIEPADGEAEVTVSPEDREFPSNYAPFDEEQANRDDDGIDDESENTSQHDAPAAVAAPVPPLLSARAAKLADQLLAMAKQTSIEITVSAATLTANLLKLLQAASGGMPAGQQADAAEEMAVRVLISACNLETLASFVSDGDGSAELEPPPTAKLEGPLELARKLFETAVTKAHTGKLDPDYDLDHASPDKIRSLLVQGWPKAELGAKERAQLIGRLTMTIMKALSTTQGLVDMLQLKPASTSGIALPGTDRPGDEDDAAERLAAAARDLLADFSTVMRQKNEFIDAVESRLGQAGLGSVASLGGSWDAVHRVFAMIGVDTIASRLGRISADADGRVADLRALVDTVNEAKSLLQEHSSLLEDIDSPPFGTPSKPGQAMRDALAKLSAAVTVALDHSRSSRMAST